MYWSGHISYIFDKAMSSAGCAATMEQAVATSTMMAKLFMSSTGLGRAIRDLEVGGSRGGRTSVRRWTQFIRHYITL